MKNDRRVDDLFNISTELIIVTVLLVVLSGTLASALTLMLALTNLPPQPVPVLPVGADAAVAVPSSCCSKAESQTMCVPTSTHVHTSIVTSQRQVVSPNATSAAGGKQLNQHPPWHERNTPSLGSLFPPCTRSGGILFFFAVGLKCVVQFGGPEVVRWIGRNLNFVISAMMFGVRWVWFLGWHRPRWPVDQ